VANGSSSGAGSWGTEPFDHQAGGGRATGTLGRRSRTLAHYRGGDGRPLRHQATRVGRGVRAIGGLRMTLKTSTRCVQFGDTSDPYGAIVPPIYQTATFRQPTASEFGEYDYTRSGNPTRSLVEQQLAELEGGTGACAFASGMAAITALTRLLESGEEIIAGDDLYGGTVRLLEQVLPRHGISVRYVDTTKVEAVRAALNLRTKLILVETPSNPLLRICDIRGIAQIAREVNALFAVDN